MPDPEGAQAMMPTSAEDLPLPISVVGEPIEGDRVVHDVSALHTSGPHPPWAPSRREHTLAVALCGPVTSSMRSDP